MSNKTIPVVSLNGNFLTTPTVRVTASDHRGTRRLLVWYQAGTRSPIPGDVLGTYRSGGDLYAMAPKIIGQAWCPGCGARFELRSGVPVDRQSCGSCSEDHLL